MDLIHEEATLKYQKNVLVLKAVKERMLAFAKAATSDKVLLGDLNEVIDYLNEHFMENHFENDLNLKQVGIYAMMNFKDIGNAFDSAVRKTRDELGPFRRLVLCVSLKFAEARARRLCDLCIKLYDSGYQACNCKSVS